MMKKSDAAGSPAAKGIAGKIAAERQKLTERLAELDRQEHEEVERARRASGQMLAEAFAKQGIVLTGKREASRLAKIIAQVGMDEVISRLGGQVP